LLDATPNGALIAAAIDQVLRRKKAEGIPTFRETAAKVCHDHSKRREEQASPQRVADAS
jgi:hypothetical protein